MRSITTLTTGNNLNDAVPNYSLLAIYQCRDTATNVPNGRFGYLLSFKWYLGADATQFFIVDEQAEVYHRYRNAGAS